VNFQIRHLAPLQKLQEVLQEAFLQLMQLPVVPCFGKNEAPSGDRAQGKNGYR
jgi:hypothetical protein